MASKAPHGNDIYDLLIDLIFSLSPKQAKDLYTELLPRYSRRSKTKLYNENGEQTPDGKVRLTEYQYKALRTKYGDTFIKRAFTEMTRYIEFLEENQDTCSKYKNKLRDYNSKTHNAYFLEKGWVHEKCKQFICMNRPKISVNPYTIEDFATAKEYIKNIPKEIRDTAMDVKMLIMKFPELKDIEEE